MTENVVSLVGTRKVDVQRGTTMGTLSSQWFSRPDDQRYLSLDELYASVKARADRSWADTIDSKAIEVRADRENAQELLLATPEGALIRPTHWSFGQLCSQIQAPANYLRTLPGPIAAIPIQYGLKTHRAEMVKVYATDANEGADIAAELRAITSPSYGRVLDAEVVDAVRKIVGDDWKVPGVIDWRTMTYDPNAVVTKRSTSLYASDRDVFVFLCRDQYPIEVGTLADGSPDLLFPGFVAANSEVGSRSLLIETMYMRGVCQNRNFWGVEGFSRLRIIHREAAPERFTAEAAPHLEQFAKEATQPVIRKVTAAKNAIVARNDDERQEFLQKRNFSKKAADDILAQVFQTDGKPAESVWDFVNGITAWARDIPHQDNRFTIEHQAGALMDSVAA